MMANTAHNSGNNGVRMKSQRSKSLTQQFCYTEYLSIYSSQNCRVVTTDVMRKPALS